MNSTNTKCFHIYNAHTAISAGAQSILGVGKWGVACGIWQQFTPWIKAPTLPFLKAGPEEKVLFSWSIKRNVHDYHLSKKWGKKEGGEKEYS